MLISLIGYAASHKKLKAFSNCWWMYKKITDLVLFKADTLKKVSSWNKCYGVMLYCRIKNNIVYLDKIIILLHSTIL